MIDKEIQTILDTLWEIKGHDKFYFDTYGKQMIKELIKEFKIN